MAEKLYGDRWKIIESLGEGGQGQVFKVRDIIDENKIYVLKRLKNTNRTERFKNEIETIKKLSHVNIVKLVGENLEGEKPYLVTEYCIGGELTFDKVSKLSTIERLSLFLTICKAIGYAHEQGVIHRDIKPANILLGNDVKTPVVADFGICFNTNEGFERLTETIEQVGARYYMPPELANGRTDDVTPQCDVYSLGKLLYWMFKGRIFDREEFIYENDKDLRNFSSTDHSMHFIYEIFEKTIKYNPNDRFLDATELDKEIQKMTETLNINGRYLNIEVPQKCVFCCIGQYEKKFFDSLDNNYSNSISFGLAYNSMHIDTRIKPRDEYPKVLFLVCNHCGNTQTFRIDIAKKDAWKKLSFEK